MDDIVVTDRVEIINIKGLHARAAAALRRVASRFDSEIMVSHEDRHSEADSIMGLLMLGASRGCVLEVSAKGKDAKDALEAVIALAGNGFGEKV